MDTNRERPMFMQTENCSVTTIMECGDGIYYFDTSGHDNTTNTRISNYSFLSTVDEKNIIYASRK